MTLGAIVRCDQMAPKMRNKCLVFFGIFIILIQHFREYPVYFIILFYIKTIYVSISLKHIYILKHSNIELLKLLSTTAVKFFYSKLLATPKHFSITSTNYLLHK